MASTIPYSGFPLWVTRRDLDGLAANPVASLLYTASSYVGWSL
jgi:hypothetical protein